MKTKEANRYFIFDNPRSFGFKSFLSNCKHALLFCYYKILQIFTFPRKIEEKKYKVSICAIFKNEAPYLKEWIEFHQLIGVEHFYMYNNNSEDKYLNVLQDYIDKGIVTLVQWEKNQAQMEAYQDCISKFSNETNWLGFIDIDEFINPIDFDNIYDFLKPYQRRYGSVLIYWLMFGTSGLKDRDRKGLVCEDFTSCWPKMTNIGKCFLNTSFKIYPIKCGAMLHHSMWTKRLLGHVPPTNSFGHLSTSRRNRANKHFSIKINHYFTKSYQEYVDKKTKGDVFFKINPHDEAYFHHHEDKCAATDTSIHRFIPKLKERLSID